MAAVFCPQASMPLTRHLRAFVAILLLAACPSAPADPGTQADASQTEPDATAEPVDASGADASESRADAGSLPDAGPLRLRTMAANLTTGTAQTYDPGEGVRIFQALKPDIALLQELNVASNRPEELRSFVDRAFGPEFHLCRESQPDDAIPNGVISRFPIVECGEWEDDGAFDRDFVWARIDLGAGRELWAVSLHLRTKSVFVRDTQAQALVARLLALVPERALLLVGGDLNTDYRTEDCIFTLASVAVTDGPYPADQSGNDATSGPRTKPLDWLLANPQLDALEVAVRIGNAQFPSGLVFDSRVFQPLSAVPPVEKTDSDALNMQHMAVVRDFLVP